MRKIGRSLGMVKGQLSLLLIFCFQNATQVLYLIRGGQFCIIMSNAQLFEGINFHLQTPMNKEVEKK